MALSKQLAGLIGPTIVAMIVSEFPLVQPHLYDAQIRPSSISRRPDVCRRPGDCARPQSLGWDWTVLLHVGGWFSGALGLFQCSRPAPTNRVWRAPQRRCSWSWREFCCCAALC